MCVCVVDERGGWYKDIHRSSSYPPGFECRNVSSRRRVCLYPPHHHLIVPRSLSSGSKHGLHPPCYPSRQDPFPVPLHRLSSIGSRPLLPRPIEPLLKPDHAAQYESSRSDQTQHYCSPALPRLVRQSSRSFLDQIGPFVQRTFRSLTRGL
jgi:hypothetical protein